MPAIVGMAHEAGGQRTTSTFHSIWYAISSASFLVVLVQPAVRCWERERVAGGRAGRSTCSAAARPVPDLGMVFPAVGGKNGVLKQGYLVKIKGTKHAGSGRMDHQRVPGKVDAGRDFSEGGQVPTRCEALAQKSEREGTSYFLRIEAEEIAGMVSHRLQQGGRNRLCPEWNGGINR